MEFFSSGPLSQRPTLYQGQVLLALRAIRPIVEAVSRLHKEKIVHRDIKWDNIFLADDSRLVLGDCGLAIKMDNADRVTDTFEKVGSTAWMPTWAFNQRLEDVKPTFDVFTLGKLLWVMIAGRPPFPVWYFEKPQYDLRKLFADDAAMRYARRILEITVVEDEGDCLPAGEDFLYQVDEAIAALELRGQIPSRLKPMRCRFCGVGAYSETSDFQNSNFFNVDDRRLWYRCNECGHLESFFFKGGKAPNVWETE
jgi:serine/threonine protein kinase